MIQNLFVREKPMDKISVIVPVYNVEKYLVRCLNSIVNQTYKNLEILVVNDGSTDNSGEIADDYAKKDSRIKVIHKVNEGLSSARNVGLRNFTGKYVGFVDSDDWIESNMYEVLHKQIFEHNTQISVASFFTATDTISTPRINLVKIPDGVLTAEKMLEYVFRLDLYNAFHIVVWNKLYSADIFNRHSLMFDESIKFAEDALFTPSVLLTAGCTGVYICTPLYHYYQRPNSLISSLSVEPKFHVLNAINMLIPMLEGRGNNMLVTCAKKEYCYQASLIVDLCIKVRDFKHLKKAQVEMGRYFHEYYEITIANPERIERIKQLIEYKVAK